MSSNLGDRLGETITDGKGIVSPVILATKHLYPKRNNQLESDSRLAFLEIRGILDPLPEDQRESLLPLSIYYAERKGDKHLGVRVVDINQRILYTGPYLPLFQAVAFAGMLGSIISEKSSYTCNITQRTVIE